MGSVTLPMTSQRMLWPKEPATAPLKVYRPDTAKANTQAMAGQTRSTNSSRNSVGKNTQRTVCPRVFLFYIAADAVPAHCHSN